MVCMSAGHVCKLCKNGRNDRDVNCRVDSDGPRKPLFDGVKIPTGRVNFEGGPAIEKHCESVLRPFTQRKKSDQWQQNCGSRMLQTGHITSSPCEEIRRLRCGLSSKSMPLVPILNCKLWTILLHCQRPEGTMSFLLLVSCLLLQQSTEIIVNFVYWPSSKVFTSLRQQLHCHTQLGVDSLQHESNTDG